jgi:hypothetical protein
MFKIIIFATTSLIAITNATLAQSPPIRSNATWSAAGVPSDFLPAGPLCAKFVVNGKTFAINVHDSDAQMRWTTIHTKYLANDPIEVATVFDYTPVFPYSAPMVPCFGNGPDGTLQIVGIINAIGVR